MKKKNSFIKLTSLLFLLAILLSAFAVSADEAPEYEPVVWEMDENRTYLMGNGIRYERYYVNGAFYSAPETTFYFYNTVSYKGEECGVYGNAAYPDIVSVQTEPGYSTVFVTAEGRRLLDDLKARVNCIYYFEDYYGSTYSLLEDGFLNRLDRQYDTTSLTQSVEVGALGDADFYEITGHDATKSKAYQHGAVYLMENGSYYYVCFEDLDNSYFDADGFFSYRAGSVPAYALNTEEKAEVDRLIASMTPKEERYILEENVIFGYTDLEGNPTNSFDSILGGDKVSASVMLVLITAFFGVLVPAGLLALGLIFANSKKTGKAKCWYAVAGGAALWILTSIIFFLLVIL